MIPHFVGILTGMDNIHSAHSTACIVEDPLLVKIDIAPWHLLTELAHNEVHNALGIIAVGSNCPLSEIIQLFWREDVEPIEMRIQKVEKHREHRDDDCENGEGFGPRLRPRAVSSFRGRHGCGRCGKKQK